jgi:signal transduction histidine kinase
MDAGRGPLETQGCSARHWAVAVLVGLASMALMELAAHRFLMWLPMFWYHTAAAAMNATVVSAAVGLYLQWRTAAVRADMALQQLRASEALRNDLTHMLVHDLRNPLTASLLSTKTLLAAGPAMGEAERSLLSIAVGSQTRLAGMLADILDVARAEEAGMRLELGRYDPAEVVREAVDEARPSAEKAEIRLSIETAPCPPVAMDAEKMRRVVGNLLANAIKFTPRGGAVVAAVRRQGDLAVISVRDTGPGVPREMRDAVFDKFGQLEAGSRGDRTSVGLGLTFCKLAVEAHGGRIWVDDAEGDGAVFALELPLAS